ncbi:MAG: acyl-CoA dehydrogenase family protein [Minwuia sp.]|uniref:acyl-CoA dehydrogenase family protein n=1 Tax=Minwuia sp. TaxID=2493630 RepID=UPI003A8B05CB
MTPFRPRTELTTHDVTNQAAPLEDYNLYDADPALKEALHRHGGGDAEDAVREMGAELGSAESYEHGRLANDNPPKLKSFDRYGQRIDEVEFHPSYHHMMALGMRHGIQSLPWQAEKGGHVVHTAMHYLLYQIECGVCCPLTMTYAAMPALMQQKDAVGPWLKGIVSRDYDGRSLPPEQKTGLTIGMAMTEKQGGSDVRANTTKAKPIGAGGPGGEYELWGHKWFCSAPMCDAFLNLAYTDEGLSCFLMPRWRPDGTRNAFQLMRLKDKLGNHSNASSEIEYHGAYAIMIGGEGRGVRTIIDMVMHTRLDCTTGPAAIMRQAVMQAANHADGRTAFQKKLNQQPLMRNVLADLSLEQEAATAMSFAVAQAYDDGMTDPEAAAFARIAVSISKYWVNKRVTPLIVEAMECHGGAGYVAESMMPRLYKEAPLNGIWEGSGNVICLDVLRAMQREPEALQLFLKALTDAKGRDTRLDRAIDAAVGEFDRLEGIEGRARRIVERLAVTWQAVLLASFAPTAVAEAFIASRLSGDWGHAFGTLPDGLDLQPMIDRATPISV